ncbi:MAG: CRISPR-associated helicase Cas3' [Burkholderiales bacterium]
MSKATIDDFFSTAYRQRVVSAFDYQRRLALEPWSDLLSVPTGMGKTAGVILAWLWKRGWRPGQARADVLHQTARRLVWCLPMRVLVEQTAENVREWLSNVGLEGDAGEGKVSVHMLMGGEGGLKTWAEHPEEDMILIGTQDMLLSRALMRGYGMSRYQWPVHFALLHNDAMWVFDEVQLMGAGLATSTQLDAFRRSFPLGRSSRSLWVSATLNRSWLDTVDFKPHLDGLSACEISDEDREQAGDRLRAVKRLEALPLSLTKDSGAYLHALCRAVLQAHDDQSQTLVIVNRVDRAQTLFRLLREQRAGKADLLIHARFRAAERAEQNRRMRVEPSSDRIIVATQAIEAGVDISSKVLVTELAPWASLVQRFGRCNRYGEHKGHGARVLWMNIDDEADPKPYTVESLAAARRKLMGLHSASTHDLPPTDEARPLSAVVRRKDLLDLFNTDPDLSGFDVDVSDYIRDSDRPGLLVFWRDMGEDPNQPAQPRPERTELCPVSIGQAKDLHKRGAWFWDGLDGKWTKLDRAPRPGMTLLLDAAGGGYDVEVGFDPALKKPPVPVIPLTISVPEPVYGEDWRSRRNKPISLADHLGHVAAHAKSLCTAVGETSNQASVVRAARWHDLGKAHEVFQLTMHGVDSTPPPYLAKSPRNARHSRAFFRHELASMLAWLAQHEDAPDTDLVAYLIAAHHGKVRMSLRAMPTEEAKAGVKRYARGVWEGDPLPALEFDGEHSGAITLKLSLMELGEGEQGPSWTARTLKLLDEHGPFYLAWLETLVRLADWRASDEEQR